MWSLKDDFDVLCKESKNLIIEQNEEYLAYKKCQRESIIEKSSNK